MRVSDIISGCDRSGDDASEAPCDVVSERVETGRKLLDGVSKQVRQTARERTADFIDRGVEEIRTRTGEGRNGASHDKPDEVLERALERTPDEFGTRSEPERKEADHVTRELEAFLRRYGLNEDRLDDETLAAIRERVTTDVGSVTAEMFEQFLADGSISHPSESESGLNAGDGPELGFTDAYSEFCTELDIDEEQSVGSVLEETLERDVLTVGHAGEQAITEGSRQFPDEGFGSVLSSELHPGRGGGSPPPRDESGMGNAVHPALTILPAVLTLLSDADSRRLFSSSLPELLTSLSASDASDPAFERVLRELFSTAVSERDVLETLRTASTGSLALGALFVANLVAMSVGAWVSRRHAPPIPEEIRGPDGETVVTDEQVRLGKKLFQANGLMNHGSVLGNGSYFGADLTADALELKTDFMRAYYARQRGADSFAALGDAEQAAVAERVERELDADAPDGSTAEYSAAEADAHRRIRERYVDRYYDGARERGIPAEFVDSPEQAERIADFACWTAWMAHTNRPGSEHSYTNDWPYAPGSGNRPTGQVLVWSVVSVLLLGGGGGAGIWAYNALDFAEPTTDFVDAPTPDAIPTTPTQYAAAWYVPVAGALFVAQTFAGALLAHYYVERTGFFGLGESLGIDIVSLLPFSVARAWHINLGILWITLLWLAGGLFLPGLFSDGDPPWQAEGATALLGALVIATVGAFAGIWLGTQGRLGGPEDGDRWWWLGSEGLEYLEIGRLWKLGLLGGLAVWTGLVLRGVRRMDDSASGVGRFLVYAGGSIALLFAASMLYTPETNMAVTEFWRWWVVHMWVEGVFEFFVTAVISVALVSMNLVEAADAETAIRFEVFAIMAAGVVGVSHHYWWVGLPDFWVPLGTTFSTLEFVPLVFLFYRSIGEYRSLDARGDSFPYTLPLLFIVGSGVWNFVGGGILGFFINLPVINYFEHGTYLTVAHAHTATFGAFGLLALGLGTYVLQVVTPEEAWNPRWFHGAFWLTNLGLVVMTVASLLPIGFIQLRTAYSEGYAAARSPEFYERDLVQTLLWARTLGDAPMILGALAFTAGAVRHLYAARRDSPRIAGTGS